MALLGPLKAWRGGTPLDLGPVRRQAVFAALVLRADTRVTHEQLLDDLWDGQPPASGHKVLPSHIHPLRKALDAGRDQEPSVSTGPGESVIRSGKGWYSFVGPGVVLDVRELGERVAAARQAKEAGDLAGALERFSDALTLFRGEPLTGLPGRRAEAERQRLLERRLALRLERLECPVLLGRSADTLDELAELSASDPLNESVLALRMRALYGSGRQAEALNAYQNMRVRLRDELGVDPGEELRRTYDAVLHQDAERLLGPTPVTVAVTATAEAPARPDAAPPGHTPTRTLPVNDLPGDAGRLIGREAELDRLTAPSLPESVSVLTVDGTAGVGKTALVVRAARTLSAQYPDGCLFVDLRAHSTQRRQSPERALQRLLRSLGAAGGELPSELDELTAAWRAATSGLRLLLVLDDALDADQVRPLLPAGAGSRVLVAGRRRLAELDADRRITLEPLASADAVSLLRHIVGEERADREPEATRELVGLCDGLPLALRIAGSRLQNRRAWTVEYLVGRMAGDDHRLGELSVGDRSVEAAFRLSYDQLAPEQRRAFRALGAVPTVEFDVLTPATMLDLPTRDTERLLEGLVDTSLLQEPRPGRYRFHDLVRVHARRLAEAEPAEAADSRRAALRLFLDAARATSDWGAAGFPTGPWPPGPPFTDWQGSEAWLDAAGGELVDVVAYAAAHGEADYACWIAEALCDYFTRQCRYHEAQTALDIALAHIAAATDQRMAIALRNCLAYTGVHQRRYTQARALFTEALHLSRHHADPGEEARALTGLGTVDLSVGQGALAIAHTTAGLDLARRHHNDWVAAMALLTRGLAHQFEGRDEEALVSFAEARIHAETDDRPCTRGRILSCAADAHLRLGQYGAAKDLFRQAVDLVEQIGNVFLCARSLTRLGTAERHDGDPIAAIALHHQALHQHRLLSPLTEPGYHWLEMDIRTRLGHAYLAMGRVREAQAQAQAVLDVYAARPSRPRSNRAASSI
ncbi:SARP family transcriptional regulator [Streptomyces ipomoeae]|nr:SARP family transcriptional regulator [Streptomyces ipomoeae]